MKKFVVFGRDMFQAAGCNTRLASRDREKYWLTAVARCHEGIIQTLRTVAAAALVLGLFFVQHALAMPGADRFATADTNKDGSLSPEEFKAAFPSLKSEAFSLIDKNGDGRVDQEEWLAFSSGHGMAAPATIASAPITSVPASPSDSPNRETLPASERGEEKTPESGNLPLLSPPAR